MGVSRYSTPAEGQFVNTYSPIPFDKLLAAGLAKDARYDKGTQYIDKATADADALNFIQGSQDEEYINNVRSTVDGVVNKYVSQDLGDANVIRSIKKELSGIDKNYVDRIQQSASNFSKFEADKRKLGLTAKQNSYLNKFDSSQFSSEDGIFNQQAVAAEDYHRVASNYFNNMKDTELKAVVLDKATGLMQTRRGVTAGSIKSRAKDMLTTFQGTVAGEQYAAYLADSGVPPEDIAKATEDFLVTTGMEFSRVVSGNTYKDNSVASGAGGDTRIPNKPSATILSEAENYKESFNDFDKATTAKKELDNKIVTIDGTIKTLEKNPALNEDKIKNLHYQREQLLSENYALNYYMDKLNTEYDSSPMGGGIQDAPDKFKAALAKKGIMPDILGNGVLENIYKDAIQGGPLVLNIDNYFEKYLKGETADLDKKIKSIKEDKTLSLSERLAKIDAQTTERKKAYQYLEENPVIADKILSTLRDEYSKGKKLVKAKQDWLEERWGGLDKSESKKISLLHPTLDNGATIRIPGTNKKVANPSYAIEEAISSRPESFDIVSVTSKKPTAKSRATDRSTITKVLNTPSSTGKTGYLNIDGINTFDENNPYATAVLYDNKGAKVDDYRIKLSDPSIKSRFAERYAIQGDAITAFKLQNPIFEKKMAKAFEKNIKPKRINVTMFDNELELRLSEEGTYYSIYNLSEGEDNTTPTGVIETPKATVGAQGEVVSNALYEIMLKSVTN